ncbi:uncharacterized protein LTR77_001173 [Saxophila tyrrhenica]|uniref:Methyltransferase type 11 domain-containing protein n=1 Tax=Saxophila tyrrhenica TaxID=1690608 RepID=A0AAV9PJD8_9PEZI|nr:hypothetical protein LTR77_001173 [Saxophila tyrrhenica]
MAITCILGRNTSLIEVILFLTAGRSTDIKNSINTSYTTGLRSAPALLEMSSTLPASTFHPSAQDRTMERSTYIEDKPQISIKRAPPCDQDKHFVISPFSDDFPTPRANIYGPILDAPVSPASSDTQSEQSSTFSKRTCKSEYFDELYDLTESESEGDLPIRLSSSVKKRMQPSRSKYPSLVIPSPSEWPTIEKMKSAATPLSPPIKLDVPYSVLSKLRDFRVPSGSSAPSLDGDSTDEDMALSSCPSTPDIEQQNDNAETWDAPVQLDPRSISLLEHINLEEPPEQTETVIEVPAEVVEEMRMIVDSPPITARMRLQIQDLTPPATADPEDELSALSVPSPGGFFASLDSSIARHTWSVNEPGPNTSIATQFYGVPWRDSEPTTLPTSTATSFYGVPWRDRPEDSVEHTVSAASPEPKSDPVTAKRVAFSAEDIIHEEDEVDEIDETYDMVIKENASAHIDRTHLWLSAQTDYMKAICEDTDTDVVDSFKDVEDAVPRTPTETSPVSAGASPSKKSVRFADAVIDPTGEKSPQVEKKRISPIHDGTFWEGWRHTKRSQRARDVFTHRQVRAEAEHVKRTSCQRQHLDQLLGRYEITTIERPAPQRPISTFLPAATEDERKEQIQRAERERQALEQMQTSSWHLSAHKELNGGKLLTSPIVETFRGRRDVRILDLGGQVHCSWAWTVAMEHPAATVYTTVSSDAEAHVAESTLEGPANHFVVAAPKTWELPFESDYFDVISARNLYAYLKTTWPKGHGADEWDLTLRECLRCLRPGGFLEFDLLDAELVHPEGSAQALGVEFAFNLKTRGYDPSSGKNFLPRLKRAGFQSIKRAWLILPVAEVLPRWTDAGKEGRISEERTTERSIGPNGEVTAYEPPITGSTKDVRAMTGLVGARMWEQWMLKLNCEMGRDEARCLEGVAKALEEAGKGDAAWRCLVGWARKSTS